MNDVVNKKDSYNSDNGHHNFDLNQNTESQKIDLQPEKKAIADLHQRVEYHRQKNNQNSEKNNSNAENNMENAALTLLLSFFWEKLFNPKKENKSSAAKFNDTFVKNNINISTIASSLDQSQNILPDSSQYIDHTFEQSAEDNYLNFYPEDNSDEDNQFSDQNINQNESSEGNIDKIYKVQNYEDINIFDATSAINLTAIINAPLPENITERQERKIKDTQAVLERLLKSGNLNENGEIDYDYGEFTYYCEIYPALDKAMFLAISNVAQKHEIPLVEFLQLIAIESNFKNKSVSKAGYKGITQLGKFAIQDVMEMSGIVREKAEIMAVNIFNSEQIFDLEKNLNLGAQYWKLQKKRAFNHLGRWPTFLENYAFYHQGEVGGKNLLKASGMDFSQKPVPRIDMKKVKQSHMIGIHNKWTIVLYDKYYVQDGYRLDRLYEKNLEQGA